MNDNTFVPPHSLPSEQAVLGGLLIDNRAWDRIGDFLAEADFYRHNHRLIYRAIKALVGAGKPCDVVTIGEWLESQELFDDAGGFDYIGTLAKNAPSSVNIKAYADIVREHAVRREVIESAREVIAEATNGAADTRDVLDNAQRRFMDIGHHGGGGPAHLMDRYATWLQKLDDRINSESRLAGASTGLADLDAILGGLEDGNFYVIAGRPGMFKTTLGENIMEAFAKRGDTALMFQLEMPGEQLLGRSMSTQTGIESRKMRRGEIDGDEIQAIMRAAEAMRNYPIYIDDQPGLSMTEIRARARRLKRQHGLRLVVIDYLQLVREKAENRVNEITNISRAMKEMAKELQCPVVALSQLNRELEKRHDKRPIASDLRDSGSIEQDADAIIFLYREGAYDDEFLYDDVTEAIVSKSRHEATGTVYLRIEAARFRFTNIAADLRRDYQLHKSNKRRGNSAPKGFEQ